MINYLSRGIFLSIMALIIVPSCSDLTTTKPADKIIDYMKNDKELDLVIMATHGRSGMGQLLHGSTADRVVHEATVPVLLVTAHTHAPEE